MTVNKGQQEPYDLGNGYGHLALVVDDLDTLHAKMKSAHHPVRDIVDFRPDGETRVARFFFATDPDGYQIEVIERGGRFQ